MKSLKSLAMMAALIAGSAGLASAQYSPRGDGGYQDQDRDRNHDGNWDRNRNNNNDNNSNAYQEGFRQSQWDATHNRRAQGNRGRSGNSDDQRAYAAGYSRGYNQAVNNSGSYGNGQYGRNGGYGNGGYGNNGSYGNGRYGNSGMQSARQYGYQDGLNDGAHDRQTGHSFRPTQDDNFKNADRGYSSSSGSRDQYKQWYRQAYQSGYQRGYNGNAGF